MKNLAAKIKMDSEVREKLAYVQQWLEEVFAGKQIPDYEINRHTVDCLYAMATQSERRTAAARLAIEDIEQKTEEYVAETNRLKSVSEWLGVTMDNLTPTAKGHIQNTAATALALDLKDCSSTNLCLSLTEFCRQQASDEVKRRKLKRERDSLQENLRQLLVKQASQKKVLSKVAEELEINQFTTVAKQVRETEFLKQKTSQYHKLVSSIKAELDEMGYRPTLSHASLLEISKEVEELQMLLSPLKAQLASYKDLPPDLSLAKIKVHEAKCLLARLEEEFSQTIDLVNKES